MRNISSVLPTHPNILPIVLCGGSGTRLWPLSRKSLPKQFVPLIGDKSLLTLTLERLKPLSSHMLLVGSEDHRFLLKEAMNQTQIAGDLLLEDKGRNTAPAMALAALWARKTLQPSDLLLFCPADHHISDTQAFLSTIAQGVDAASKGSIVTFGIEPNHPSTAYGYVKKGKPWSNPNKESNGNTSNTEGVFDVLGFVEKPKLELAEKLVLGGEHVWNAGIFLMRVDTLLQALDQHAKEIFLSCQASINKATLDDQLDANRGQADSRSKASSVRFVRPDSQALLDCPSTSIDYAVMEHHADMAVVFFKGQWSDVGSWNAVANLTEKDSQGNQIVGKGLADQTQNTYILAPERTVVALGVENLLIIDTPDALLVADRSKAEEVKGLVDQLKTQENPTALTHRKVARPWGWYDSVDHGERFQVKRISVKAGASLSLQKHQHRAEHWIVVKGTAEVTNGERVFLLQENESTFIPAGAVHRLHNPGAVDLEMIEVQSGSYLGEDDIVRLEDSYGRG